MNQNKNREQTLESAQYGLEIIFKQFQLRGHCKQTEMRDIFLPWQTAQIVCNRWLTRETKTQARLTTGRFTMGNAIYHGVCNQDCTTDRK